MKKILLTFNGQQDPFNKSENDGPILTAFKELEFDELYLFITKQLEEKAKQTIQELQKRYKNLEITPINLDLEDPTDYESILAQLRKVLTDIIKPSHDKLYYISVSSGTSQIHTCWFLLAASGEIPANILQIREEKYLKDGECIIKEINPRAKSIPSVIPNIQLIHVKNSDPETIEKALKEIGLLGQSESFKKLIKEVAQIAKYDKRHILLQGETGTGKELIARLIHKLSPRSQKTYNVINCALLEKNLLRSELFGHKKGAFTGADRDKIGIIEQSDGGILFLDEITELPLEAQAALLRFLQEGEIQPIGGEIKKVDVVIIAASNIDFKEAIRKGTFREDLYYRFSQPITLPSLKERKEDIPLIINHFLNEFNKKYKEHKVLTQDALYYLQQLDYSGNIRELGRKIEEIAIKSEVDTISRNEIEKILNKNSKQSHSCDIPEIDENFSISHYIETIEYKIIQEALKKANNVQTKAASYLKISPQALNKKLKKYNESP